MLAISCFLCYKGSFQLSRIIFNVLATFQIQATFGQYPCLIHPLKGDHQRILRIVKGKASVGKETETAAAAAEAGWSCYGTATWTTGKLPCWCHIQLVATCPPHSQLPTSDCQLALLIITSDSEKNACSYQVVLSLL